MHVDVGGGGGEEEEEEEGAEHGRKKSFFPFKPARGDEAGAEVSREGLYCKLLSSLNSGRKWPACTSKNSVFGWT